MFMRYGRLGVFFGLWVGLINLVSAQLFQGLNLEQGVNQLYTYALDFLRPIFIILIGPYSTNEFFLQKCLLLILMFVIINTILKKVKPFKKQAGVSFVIAGVISIISIRFMSDNQFINGILLPYGALGIALVTILPFMVWFYFIHATKMSGVGRRLSWILFGIIFISLFILRYPELSPFTRNIYWAVLAGGVLAFVFDRGIQRYFFAHELNLFYRGAASKAVASLQAEYMEILNVNTPEAQTRRDSIEENLRRLGAGVP